MAEQFQRHAIQILSKDMSDESEDQCEGESPWQVEDLEASKRNNVDNEVNSDKLQFFYKWFGWIYDHINL